MKKVLNYLAEHESRFINELCEYVSIPSVSAQPKHVADMKAAADWLVRHCTQIGMETELRQTTGNPVVIARTPIKRVPGKKHFLVYGHYDVQPAEPFGLW